MTEETTVEAIPDCVLDVLEDVRASGETNMLAFNTVLSIISRDKISFEVRQGSVAVPSNSHSRAFMWLAGNEGRYMEALIAMRERRSE